MHPRDILPGIGRRRRTPDPKPKNAAGTVRLEQGWLLLFPALAVQSRAADGVRCTQRASRKMRPFRHVSGNRAEDYRQVHRDPEPPHTVLQWWGGMRG